MTHCPQIHHNHCRLSLPGFPVCLQSSGTTSRPAAATEMRPRVSPAMHPKVFLHRMTAFLLQLTLFLGTGTGSEYASMHTLRHANIKPRLAVYLPHTCRIKTKFGHGGTLGTVMVGPSGRSWWDPRDGHGGTLGTVYNKVG